MERHLIIDEVLTREKAEELIKGTIRICVYNNLFGQLKELFVELNIHYRLKTEE